MPAILSRIGQALLGGNKRSPKVYRPMRAEELDDPIGLYAVLEAYYHGQGLYEGLTRLAAQSNLFFPGMKSLRNPAHRAVEFYVSQLYPAIDDVEAEDEAVKEAVQQVMKWSNWDARRRMAARKHAMLGDLFIKVVGDGAEPVEGEVDEDGEPRTRQTRVIWQVIDPSDVPLFDVDERGYLTLIRIATERTERDPEQRTVRHWDVEEWDKGTQTLYTWTTDQHPGEKKREEAKNVEETSFEEFGVDFIPIVHGKFKDTGELRGLGCYNHAIDKIDEANLLASRLGQMLFRNNDVTWALETIQPGSAGRTPLPPPRISTDDGETFEDDGTITLGGERFLSLPGGTQAKALVPQINFAAALDTLKDHMVELEYDLPELGYYRIRDLAGQMSGIAMRLAMTPALEKAAEAAENAESLTMRAGEIAITIGKWLELPEFDGIGGSYEEGSYEHSFRERSLIPVTPQEEGDNRRKLAEAATAMVEAGLPTKYALMEVYDLSEEEVEELLALKEAESEAALERAERTFNRGGGNDPFPPDGDDDGAET